MSEDLRFPIGKFVWPETVSAGERVRHIETIAAASARLREAVAGLTEEQFETPYREGGWTVRQVVHHVPESHMNSYIRFKLALTEDTPVIKPYDEAAWGLLGDIATTPPDVSLALLDALHIRWVALLRSLKEADWSREFRHPEIGVIALDKNLALYAWHGNHHIAHITRLRKSQGW
ncbi:MAG: hypothetical protein QOJ99_3005 [Bryobacterales bacterium]|nr:hypothetical protein [Bryobacterales bacterium]